MKKPFTHEQKLTIVDGILGFVLILVVLQLWLLMATMNAYLGGFGIAAALSAGAEVVLYDRDVDDREKIATAIAVDVRLLAGRTVYGRAGDVIAYVALFVSALNTPSYGGGMPAVPGAGPLPSDVVRWGKHLVTPARWAAVTAVYLYFLRRWWPAPRPPRWPWPRRNWK